MFYAEKMPYIQTIPCIKVFELYPHYQSCPSTTSPHVLRFLLGCEAPCLPVSPKPTCTSTVSNTKDPVTAVGQREEKATEENTAEPCVRGFSVFLHRSQIHTSYTSSKKFLRLKKWTIIRLARFVPLKKYRFPTGYSALGKAEV